MAISYVRSIGLTGDGAESGVEIGSVKKGGYVRMFVWEVISVGAWSSFGRRHHMFCCRCRMWDSPVLVATLMGRWAKRDLEVV